MKRILLITNVFPPRIGGPATFIDQLALSLTQMGHKVTVLCTSETINKSLDKDRPFRVVRILYDYNVLFLIRAFFLIFREMFFHNTILLNGGFEYQTYLSAKILGKKYVSKVSGDSAWETARNLGLTDLNIDEFQKYSTDKLFAPLMTRRNYLVTKISMIITPSDYLKSLVTLWGVDPRKVTRIYNAVQQKEFQSYLPQKRVENTFRIVFVGRLTNWKGIETILLAIQELSNVKVSIAGEGPEYPHLVELARQLNVHDKVDFLGKLNRDQIKEIVSHSHVLVLLSLYEGLSHTLLEAMAMGIPCIASRCGGNPETIRDGEDGVLIPPLNVNALKHALTIPKDDENYRYRLACNAKKRIKDFDFDETVQQTAAILSRYNLP